MKYLEVHPLQNDDQELSVTRLALMMDTVKKNKIGTISWAQYAYLPAVEFSIAYNGDRIFLKYYVKEKFIRAANCTVNGAVWEDSCVEFFISFGDDTAYYNFEFNCTGTPLAGYGKSKTERQLLSEQLVSQIASCVIINKNGLGDDIYWELTVVIPNSVFCFNEAADLKGKTGRANFYKCGDLLPVPHFVSWNAVSWPEPNFHLPEFFGTIAFV